MRCKFCGTKVKKGYYFCQKCNFPVYKRDEDLLDVNPERFFYREELFDDSDFYDKQKTH